MNTLSQFSDFLYATQNRAFEETRDKIPTVYTKYTKAGDASEADYRSVTGIKLGPMGYTPLGGQAHKDEYAPGTTLVIPYKKFTIMVITPSELIDDMYANGRIDDQQVKLFASFPKDFAESATWTCEVIASDFQKRGTSATATATWQGAGRDGLSLFSASHVTTKGTPVTWSNLQSAGAMNMFTLMEGVTMLENIPDETGRPLGSIGGRIGIVHGRYWEWRVPELIKSVKQPDTLNNNPNAMNLRGVSWEPILNPYLGATDTSWMLVNLDDNELLHFMKKKPTFAKDRDPYTGNQINGCEMRFAIGFDSAKCALLNPGV